MTIRKLALITPLAMLATAAPVGMNINSANPSGGLFRLEVQCAAAAEAFDSEIAPNAGCEPATGYVCTTPRADYLDKRPI